MPDDEYPDGSVPYAPHQGIVRLPFEAIILILTVIIFNFSLGFSVFLFSLAFCFLYPKLYFQVGMIILSMLDSVNTVDMNGNIVVN